MTPTRLRAGIAGSNGLRKDHACAQVNSAVSTTVADIPSAWYQGRKRLSQWRHQCRAFGQVSSSIHSTQVYRTLPGTVRRRFQCVACGHHTQIRLTLLFPSTPEPVTDRSNAPCFGIAERVVARLRQFRKAAGVRWRRSRRLQARPCTARKTVPADPPVRLIHNSRVSGFGPERQDPPTRRFRFSGLSIRVHRWI